MLKISNLCVNSQGHPILKGIELNINPGEIHVLMGPNGSGKSTLLKTLSGHKDYKIDSGKIEYFVNGKYETINEWAPDLRAKEGVFMAFQYPTEISGVSNFNLLNIAFNAICKHHGAPPLSENEFKEFVDKKISDLEINKEKFLHDSLNENFSGGEKKKSEILQMLILNPRLILLDETDSGLDVDALKRVFEKVKFFKNSKNAFLIITHYERIVNYVKPDFVHVISKGRIIKTGDASLALKIEETGYSKVKGK